MLSLNANLQCLDHSLLFLCSTTDKQLLLLQTNPFFCDTFGLREETTAGLSWLDATRITQREKCMAAAKDCLRSPGKTVQLDTSLPGNGTETRWFRWEISALAGDGNTVQGLYFVGTEITAQKDNERQLAAVKEKLFSAQAQHSIFTNALMEGLVIINGKHEIIEHNTAAEKILGLAAGQMSGMTTPDPQWKCIHEDGTDFPGPMHPSHQAVLTGKPQRNVVMGIQKKEGALIWISINAQPVFGMGPGELPTEAVCSFADITRMKRTELALRKSEHRWKFALEGAGDGVWEYNLHTREVYYSRLYKKMIGYKEREFKNDVTAWRSRIHPEDLYLIEAIESDYAADTIDHHAIEYRIRNKSGGYSWILDRGMVIERTPEGKPLKVIGTNKNITGRKNEEEQIRNNERRFRAIFNSTFQSIGLMKPDGTLIEANQTALDFGGLQADDVINKPFWEANWWAASDDTRRKIKESTEKAAQGEFIRYEIEALGADGATSWVDFSIKPLKDETGNIVLLIPECRDINEQRVLQQKLAKEEASKKQDVVEAIIGAQERERQEIAFELHDNVNQLLSTGMLVLDVAENYPVHAKEYIRQSKNAIQKAIDEIRKLTHNLSPATLDFVGLTASIQDIMKEINPTGKLHISFVREGLVDEKTISPSIQLAVFRIIQEQLTNIIKHSGASKAVLKLVLANNTLQLEIRDNGNGFDIPATRRGLGLSNIFTRVEHYKGTAVLETEPGKGCLLMAVLPVTIEENPVG